MKKNNTTTATVNAVINVSFWKADFDCPQALALALNMNGYNVIEKTDYILTAMTEEDYCRYMTFRKTATVATVVPTAKVSEKATVKTEAAAPEKATVKTEVKKSPRTTKGMSEGVAAYVGKERPATPDYSAMSESEKIAAKKAHKKEYHKWYLANVKYAGKESAKETVTEAPAAPAAPAVSENKTAAKKSTTKGTVVKTTVVTEKTEDMKKSDYVKAMKTVCKNKKLTSVAVKNVTVKRLGKELKVTAATYKNGCVFLTINGKDNDVEKTVISILSLQTILETLNSAKPSKK